MRELLLTVPTPLLVLMVVGGSALLTAGVTYFVRMRVSEKIHQANNEVAGFLFSAVAVVYGVLLAFIVLVVWQTFLDAQVTVEREANIVVNLFRIGQELPEPYGAQLQEYATDYAQRVVDIEWSEMGYARSSPVVGGALENLWTVHRALHAANLDRDTHQEQFFQLLDDLGDERRIRLLDSRSELPGLMWVLLIGGGIVTLGFTLFLRAPTYQAHLLMAGMFAGLVAFVLVLIIELDTPFSGDVRIEPQAFRQALELFDDLRTR
jgi:hypothetical protein